MDKKICLITGSSRGLGLSLARQYKSRGYFVIGLARHAIDEAERCNFDDFYICNLASTSDLDDMICALENKYKQIDVLVHNAAIQNDDDIVHTPFYYDILSQEVAVNFLAPIKLTTSLLPLLIKAEATIVIITSLLQLGPKASAPGYCASKAALANWTNNLRVQLEGTSVQVMEVIPGLIKTNMTAKAAKEGEDPDKLAHIIVQNMDQQRLILPGAKLAWFIGTLFPNILKKKLLASSD